MAIETKIGNRLGHSDRAVAVLGFSGDQRIHPMKTFSEFGQTTTRQARVLQRLHEDPRVDTYHWTTGIGARVMSRFARSERYKHQRPRLSLSNMYLTVLVDLGAIGLLFFLLFFSAHAHIFRHLGKLSEHTANEDLRAALAGLVAAASYFFSDGLYQLPLIIIFFAALGLGVGLASQYGPQTRRCIESSSTDINFDPVTRQALTEVIRKIAADRM